MSDITGPPSPKPVQSVSHGTDRASGVSRDKQQTTGQQTADKRDPQSRSEQKDAHQVRDPAVSISASAAHLHVGEELKQKVREIDIEGRPIIVTETATFALKPDAGLRPGDDVILQVKEAGKTVAADLLRHNGLVIDPPLRLSLVVIAVHTPPQHTTSREQDSKAPLPPISASYKPHHMAVRQGPETEILANILGRSYTPPPTGPSLLKSDNPDPTARASSADLTTLISAQQVLAKQPAQPSPTSPPLTAPPSPSRLIQETELTKLGAEPAAAAQAAGLGPLFSAVQVNGPAINLQVIDPTISSVPPKELATIQTVITLSANDARTLNINPQQITTEGALARVETDKGIFIAAEKNVAGLVGEQVRVSPHTEQQATVTTQQTQSATDSVTVHKARLQGTGGGVPKAITVTFTATAPQEAAAGARPTEVNTVQVIRGFLTAEGPKNDLQLGTSLGTITLTLANNLRPHVGDPITILPVDSASQQAPLTGTQPIVTAEAIAQAASTTALAAGSPWPALSEAYSLIAADNPLVASTLAARTAEGGAKMVNSMMFLFTALQGNSRNSWLGDKAEGILSNKNSSLLGRIKADLSRFLSPPETSGEWRSMLLPLDFKNGEASMLAFLFGHTPPIDPEEKGNQNQNLEDDNEKQDRFVIEVDFTILGPVQLNGLIRGQRFDLTLHSYRDLPGALQSDSRTLFENALAANGFSGQIGFIKTDTFPVNTQAIIAAQNR